MPIHLRENQYRGINAHLHSYLQQHSDWSIFHGAHIIHLCESLQVLLPPESGYLAVPEKSLQIIRDDLMTGQLSSRRTIPDIGIYRTSPKTGLPTSGSVEAVVPGAVVPLMETLSESENVIGVVIYRQGESGSLGTPVTRIELLSPGNKPPGSHYRQYLAKRDETLQSGINLVELDYLHQQRSPIGIVPDYTRREAKSYPYVILVNSPYPSLSEGKTAIYGFRVDDFIPSITVPLAGSDQITLDLGAVYNHTFMSNFAYGLHIVNYEVLPEGFDTYDEEDQQRIRHRMALVAQASNSSN
ncbi:MAG: DUF4058 family protein [Anaerolineae bacterium]|nr:DUF4058 family protein [Anaerolineae bacterium]